MALFLTKHVPEIKTADEVIFISRFQLMFCFLSHINQETSQVNHLAFAHFELLQIFNT